MKKSLENLRHPSWKIFLKPSKTSYGFYFAKALKVDAFTRVTDISIKL